MTMNRWRAVLVLVFAVFGTTMSFFFAPT